MGRLDRITDPHENITPATYNTLGQLLTLDNPDAGLTEWRYTIAGELRANVTPNLRLQSGAIVYSTQGEVTSVYRVLNGIGPNVGSLQTTTRFVYDSVNRLQSMEYPDHERVSYEYDSGGALQRVVGTLPNQEPREYVHDIRYDLFGHRVFQELGNHSSRTLRKAKI